MTGFEPERLKVLCIAPTDYVQKKIEAYSASLRLHVTAELLCEFALTKFGPNIYAHAIEFIVIQLAEECVDFRFARPTDLIADAVQ